MKTNPLPLGKCFAVALMLLSSSYSFSQYIPASSPNKADSVNKRKPNHVKKNIISFGFFSPLNQHLSFGYDRLVGEDIIFTSQLGIIGPGFAQTQNPPAGGFIEAGVKLFFSPDYIIEGMHRYNAMQGGYFKPQIIVSAYSESYSYYYNYYNNGYYPYNYSQQTTRSYTYVGVAVMLNYGRQWIIAHSISMDMYVGIGYCTTNNPGNNSNNNGEPNNSNFYSFIGSGGTFPIAIAGGINIGVPF